MTAWPNAPLEQEEKARAGGESWLFIVISDGWVCPSRTCAEGRPHREAADATALPSRHRPEHLAPLTGAQSLPQRGDH
jgi:hypothetical protein